MTTGVTKINQIEKACVIKLSNLLLSTYLTGISSSSSLSVAVHLLHFVLFFFSSDSPELLVPSWRCPAAASSAAAGTSGSNTADKHRVCVTSASWNGINLRHFQKSLDRAAGHIVDSC